MIIAVDGPSAAGKGTIGRAIAQKLGLHYLDTGGLYRMVGLTMLRTQTAFSEVTKAEQFARDLNVDEFTDADLRNEAVGAAASKVAAIPEVRAALLKFQRDFAMRAPGAVLDGRDIGTVICPDADFKFYITASVEARAKRRHLESPGATLQSIKAVIETRDQRDATRSTAPAKPAADAMVIDTSDMEINEAVAQVMAHIQK